MARAGQRASGWVRKKTEMNRANNEPTTRYSYVHAGLLSVRGPCLSFPSGGSFPWKTGISLSRFLWCLGPSREPMLELHFSTMIDLLFYFDSAQVLAYRHCKLLSSCQALVSAREALGLFVSDDIAVGISSAFH